MQAFNYQNNNNNSCVYASGFKPNLFVFVQKNQNKNQYILSIIKLIKFPRPSTIIILSTIMDNKISKLKSIESLTPVKILLYNQSNRKVTLNWVNYYGQEVLYHTLGKRDSYVIDSYVTHPWVFRDSETKMLAVFDAFVANYMDLFSFMKFKNFNLNKRFQTGSRILFPREYDYIENHCNFIIIKNGVHSLEEVCLNQLLKIYPSTNNENNILKNLPIIDIKAITEGQSYQEFLESK